MIDNSVYRYLDPF